MVLERKTRGRQLHLAKRFGPKRAFFSSKGVQNICHVLYPPFALTACHWSILACMLVSLSTWVAEIMSKLRGSGGRTSKVRVGKWQWFHALLMLPQGEGACSSVPTTSLTATTAFVRFSTCSYSWCNVWMDVYLLFQPHSLVLQYVNVFLHIFTQPSLTLKHKIIGSPEWATP